MSLTRHPTGVRSWQDPTDKRVISWYMETLPESDYTLEVNHGHELLLSQTYPIFRQRILKVVEGDMHAAFCEYFGKLERQINNHPRLLGVATSIRLRVGGISDPLFRWIWKRNPTLLATYPIQNLLHHYNAEKDSPLHEAQEESLRWCTLYLYHSYNTTGDLVLSVYKKGNKDTFYLAPDGRIMRRPLSDVI